MNKILHKDDFRFGWELEYQNSDYGDRDELDYDNGELDEDRYFESQSEAVSDERNNRLNRSCLSQRKQNAVKNKLIETLTFETIGELESELNLCGNDVYTCYESYLRSLDEGETINVDTLVEHITNDCYICDYLVLAEDYINDCLYESIEIDTSDYYTYPRKCTELDLPRNLERVSDGSVSGGEIRPIKKQTLENACDLLLELEQAYSFGQLDVDKECSFHVHISNSKLKHSYGTNLQCFMYQYLHKHLNELPACVVERLAHSTYDWRKEYFPIELSENRYSAISFRHSLGSWEFRFMGNLSCANDGVECMHFAQKCYEWAYRQSRLLGKTCVHVDNFKALAANIQDKASAIVKRSGSTKRCA